MSKSFQNKFLQGTSSLTAYEKGQARANIDAGILSGFRNKLINPFFAIGQRAVTGTIPAGGVGWVGDRWLCNNSTNQPMDWVLNQNPVFMGALPEHVQSWLLFSFSVAPTSGTVAIFQRVEGVGTLAGEDATLTGYYSFGASAQLIQYVEQSFGAGGSPTAGAYGVNAPMAAGQFTRRSDKLAMPTVSTKTKGPGNRLDVVLQITPRNATTYSLSGMSLVRGDATVEADPSSPRHIQQELALCQRYYQLNPPILGRMNQADSLWVGPPLQLVPMRAPPSRAIVNGTAALHQVGVAFLDIMGLGAGYTPDLYMELVPSAFPGAGFAMELRAGAIGFDAEL